MVLQLYILGEIFNTTQFTIHANKNCIALVDNSNKRNAVNYPKLIINVDYPW